MQIIGNALQAIAAELDLIYVRAININDLNQLTQNIKVDKPLLVYANMSPIDFDSGDLTNHETARIETTILVLDLHKSADPTATQIDELLAPLLTKINFVYDLISGAGFVAPAADVERESLTAAESIEMTDENLGGYEMVLTVPINRQLYNCEEPPPGGVSGTFSTIIEFGENIRINNIDPVEITVGMNIHVISDDGEYNAIGAAISGANNPIIEIPYTVNAGAGTYQEILTPP